MVHVPVLVLLAVPVQELMLVFVMLALLVVPIQEPVLVAVQLQKLVLVPVRVSGHRSKAHLK